ncbi:uncharacterized protein LOC117943105 isoform X2 [Etheostoma cragini]|uniref:uncharacterized protein LOC117943105 isoform X2 n=1 Tax=Etheostoma cragini TaxID=417921 RepID=UPI00155EC028|nr:uncharacterized protein LOC117943105 isoform X2 [Etheostoma cragini]
MGSDFSQEQYNQVALVTYEDVLQHQPCLLPDVGIDDSLLRYSGNDSNAALQAFSTEMLNTVPGYVGSLGSVLGAMTSVPNAVGLGALVISMIIEIAVKIGSQTSDNTYSMLRRVFGEEKASSVRDTMSEYLRRHQVFMNNDQRLREEMRRLEQQLSNHLTILRNSLQHDGQMSSRGFKIWVNGAAFHVQMLIHGARLDVKTGTPASDYVNAIEAAIALYMQDLDRLLEKYKTFKIDTIECTHVFADPYSPGFLYMANNEIQDCKRSLSLPHPDTCNGPKAMTNFMDVVYSNYEPITGLKSYFLNVKNNVNSLIRQRGSFTVPSAAG